MELESLFKQHQDFSIKCFPNSTWQSSLRGLEREIKEVEAERHGSNEQATEYVDCIMYLLDSMSRAGVSMEQFKQQFVNKLLINKNREWGQNQDGSYSHVK